MVTSTVTHRGIPSSGLMPEPPCTLSPRVGATVGVEAVGGTVEAGASMGRVAPPASGWVVASLCC